MMKIYDGREFFYQWDLSQKITSDAFEVGDKIHFFNIRQTNALVVSAYELDGKVVADVPNILLQTAVPIKVWKYVHGENSAQTVMEDTFKVEQRAQPYDYFYTETELYALRKEVEDSAKKAVELAMEAEKTSTENEQARATAEQNRVETEETRAIAETERVNAESDRAKAETARKTAETNRGTAESQRVTAEQSRVEAEAQRVTAEQERVAAEELRQANFESLPNNIGNAVKGVVSGEVVRVDDVSPVEHTAKVSVRGRNLFDISKVPITGGSTKISVTEVGTSYIVVTSESGYNSNGFCSTGVALSQLCPQLKEGDEVTLTAESPSIMNCFYLDTSEIADGTAKFWYFGNGRVVTKEMLNAVVCVYGFNAIQGGGVGECAVSNIQIKDSNLPTEYEPYIDPTTVTVTRYGANETDNPQTYIPSTDGTCEVEALSPTMTLVTDNPKVTIDLEYNQDTTKALENVKSDLRELDNTVAEIILNGGGGGDTPISNYYTKDEIDEKLGDVETALDSILAIQESLIGGDSV